MNTYTLAFLGWPEILAIAAVVLLLFGAKRLPALARGLCDSVREVRKVTREAEDDPENTRESPRSPRPPV